MYFVDRKRMDNSLAYMERLHHTYPLASELDSTLKELALERLVHGWIEAIIDVGNQMIDGFIMRDPGSYEDIIDILEDERVIEKDEAASLKEVIALRKSLVQDFTNVDHHFMNKVIAENKQALESFPASVRHYVEQELGPVSAFLPEE